MEKAGRPLYAVAYRQMENKGKMKAVVYEKYGAPDVLHLKEVDKPIPKDNEVLVKVHAASINSWDYDLLRGKPFVARLVGLFKPRFKILGADIAGQVVAVGRNVRQFQVGDEVFGDLSEGSWGGFAEYACASEAVIAHKSAKMTFEAAAAIPQAGFLALQGLRDMGHIKAGNKVLINGAGGCVGSFAVQIAKFFGAEVTGVDRTEKLDMLRSIGADHVIDYTKEDFTTNGLQYDLILDMAAYHSISDYERALTPKGIYVMTGGTLPRIVKLLLLGPRVSKKTGKKMGLLMLKPNQKDLIYFNELFEAGKVVPFIDKRYSLSEVPDAFRYFGSGQFKGKLVISVEQKNMT
jgi:NADPH:quinone reductase-like Zn-dependent oxidoreductase